jgi:uncharacterized membrane-anchored protein YhcB (DUF1043 family)
MSDGFTPGLIIGIIIGILIIGFTQNVWSGSDKNQIKNVIEVCEKDLPRNQHCIITGIVEKR